MELKERSFGSVANQLCDLGKVHNLSETLEIIILTRVDVEIDIAHYDHYYQ